MSKFHTWMKQNKFSLLLALIVAVALLLGGCGGGSDSYDNHTQQVSTKTATPLIEADTLKEWMDKGLVNAGYIQDNVVILNVGGPGANKIPGAYEWIYEDEVRTTRLEGLAFAGSMVQTGDVIDSVLQRSGVNDLSTIVLTSDDTYRPTVAYFTLRYWGFPKDKIKVLNGFNAGWDAAYPGTRTTETPADVQGNPYNFSVRNNGKLNDQLRYSIAEVIQAVDANNTSLTATGERTFNIVQNTTGTPTLATAIGISQGAFHVSNVFNSADDIAAVLDAADFDYDLPTITHCGSGLSCTPIFFALDAILGLNISVWDGSTGQWRAYGAAFSDETIAPEAWNVNTNDRSTSAQTRRENDPAIDSELLNDFLRIQDISDPTFNQIEEEDKLYMESGGEDGAPEAGADVEGNC